MKKLITATALAAFVIASGTAMAEDSNQKSPLQKSPTTQQMDNQATSGAKMNAQTPVGTTGAATNMNSSGKSEASTIPGKPTNTVKDSVNGGK